MYYKEFKNMREIYKEGSEHNGYEIIIINAERNNGFNPEYAGQLDQEVVVLRDNNKKEIVMSDSWMEQNTNLEFVTHAEGHVLIGGLGIGMIVLAIQDKPEVESITVVEISEDVRDLVLPYLKEHLNDKVKIVISDINDYQPDRVFDTVYCDIWNTIDSENLDEMDNLTDKFEGYAGKISHWRYDYCYELHLDEEMRYGW